jgi:hypothetical protein
MDNAQARYILKIIVPLGIKILDSPRPESSGARMRRTEAVGVALQAKDILIIAGVPYGELISRDPQKPEYIRISEAGGLVKDQLTGKAVQFDNVLTYCQVTNLDVVPATDPIVSALNRIADALEDIRYATIGGPRKP